MYAHFLYSTSCHKHFCKVNEQKQARRVEHSLYLPCCLKEVRIFDCVFSSPLLHSAWCSHVLQKDRSVLFITFIPLSPKYPSIVHSGSCFYPVSTPALSSGTGWAEHLWQHPLCSSYLSARESRWYSIPGACSAPGALPRQLWGAQTGMVLLHVCGTLEVFVVGWLVFPQFGVYCIFFLWLNKAAPIVGELWWGGIGKGSRLHQPS